MEVDDDFFPEMTPEQLVLYEKRHDCNHEFKEEYYGNECIKCGQFYAHGNAPWDIPDDEEEDDEIDPDEEDALEQCGQIADGTCLLAGTEYCDWECPFGREV